MMKDGRRDGGGRSERDRGGGGTGRRLCYVTFAKNRCLGVCVLRASI